MGQPQYLVSVIRSSEIRGAFRDSQYDSAVQQKLLEVLPCAYAAAALAQAVAGKSRRRMLGGAQPTDAVVSHPPRRRACGDVLIKESLDRRWSDQGACGSGVASMPARSFEFCPRAAQSD